MDSKGHCWRLKGWKKKNSIEVEVVFKRANPHSFLLVTMPSWIPWDHLSGTPAMKSFERCATEAKATNFQSLNWRLDEVLYLQTSFVKEALEGLDPKDLFKFYEGANTNLHGLHCYGVRGENLKYIFQLSWFNHQLDIVKSIPCSSSIWSEGRRLVHAGDNVNGLSTWPLLLGCLLGPNKSCRIGWFLIGHRWSWGQNLRHKPMQNSYTGYRIIHKIIK